MLFLNGTEPAGFGCSASRTDRKLGRRSLYTSLLPSATNSGGCRRSGSGVATPGGGNDHSGVTDDYNALQREELLRLYLEEEPSSNVGGGWGELFFQRLRDAFSFVKEQPARILTTRFKAYYGGTRQRTSPFSHGRCRAGGERQSEIDDHQNEKEKKKSPLLPAGVEDAHATVKRFWRRLRVGKWNDIYVLLPVCAVGAFLFALALLLWFHTGIVEEEVPEGRDWLHTARNAAGDLPAATTDEELLLRAKHTEQYEDCSGKREQRTTFVKSRNASPAFRTKDHHHDYLENQGRDRILADLSMLAASAPMSGDDVVRVPMRRRIQSGPDAARVSPFSIELQQYLALKLAQRQKKIPLMEPGAPDAMTPLRADVIIHDFMNSQYVIELDVGTPQQVVRVIADTGSSDFWACSEKCGVFCMLHKVYHHSKSSTYLPDNSPYNITYVSGPVSGFLSVDNVSVGGLTAHHLLFAEADNLKGLGPAFFFGHFDGVLGMGLPATATHGLKPFMQTAIEQNLLKKWVFAFYLSSDDKVDGELTLGGYNANHIDGPIVYTPLVDSRYWMINSQGLQVKQEVISTTTKVIVDSGTSLIAGPLDEVDRIAQMFGAFTVPMIPKGTYLISCEEAFVLDDLTLMIEGQAFTVRAADLIIRVSEIKGVPCLFGMIGLQILEGITSYKGSQQHQQHRRTREREQIAMLQRRALESHGGSLLTRLLRAEEEASSLFTADEDETQQEQEHTTPQERRRGSVNFSFPLRAAMKPLTRRREQNIEAAASFNGKMLRHDERLTDLGRLWVFGDIFMRGVYTIFDYDERRIGVAKLRIKKGEMKKQGMHNM